MIVHMGDFEAEEFCAKCKQQVGLGFRDEWEELDVAIGERLVKVQAGTVTLIDGRDKGNVVKNAFIGRVEAEGKRVSGEKSGGPPRGGGEAQ